ncbi:uncharacterized protein METZ01_LOCUS465198, partial [marine metagenome]
VLESNLLSRDEFTSGAKMIAAAARPLLALLDPRSKLMLAPIGP